jgi:predicted chitinase
MSIVQDQSTFLLQVAELIHKAVALGFQVSAGELYRTPEQQALHVKNGRSTTMSSQHLKRLAVDLNFFKLGADGQLHLTYDVEELRPIGQFWENLDPANRWGGNWSTFKDTPHFERREASPPTPAVAPSPTTPMAANAAPAKRRGAGLLVQAVGARCPNQHDDVATVQHLLNLSFDRKLLPIDDGRLKCDGALGKKTLDAIMAFQRTALGETTPEGKIEVDSPTLFRLCSLLADDIDAVLLRLAYLRAADEDVTSLAEAIGRVMSNRNIDTPLQRAHFLAQIGHESGELRFRSELASGEAYEGRRDLGNTQPGDGRRYKGRGLIQLTGRANYAEYGRALGREAELLEHPERVADEIGLCIDVAAWFWSRRELNALAEKDDLTGITRRINGGLNGLEDRRRLLKRCKALLGI